MKKTVSRIFNYTDRSWYPFAVSILTALDIFVGFIPSDALLVSAVLARPRRWLPIALMVTLGNVLGATLLCSLVLWDPLWLQNAFPHFFLSGTWQEVAGFFDAYGGLALLLGILGPIPIQAFLILPLLAGFPAERLLLIYLFGRLGKVSLVAWLASKAPELLARWSLAVGDRRQVLETLKRKSIE